jgi:hypothetical protein
MKSQRSILFHVLIALFHLQLALGRLQAQEGLVISEFLAVNLNSGRDDFGESSDFVEVYNGTPSALNLEGYYLTDALDNLTQWRFPATNLLSGQHLVIWASGRDRAQPGRPLHTNFRLSSNGDALALVKPDGTTVVHKYEFGPQVTDRSYGLEVEILSSTSLNLTDISARYFVPTNNTLSNRWTGVAFNDGTWQVGKAGFGFDTNPASLFAPLITTDVRAPMLGASVKRSSLYVRIPFVLDDLSQAANPLLLMQYDDGFVAYLNGTEIARRNLPAATVPSHTSVASSSRTNAVAIVPEELSTLALVQGFRTGTNVLAIHAINRSQSDSDLLLLPNLITRSIRYLTGVERYFASPSVGSGNAPGYPGSSSGVNFSVKSTTFFTPFELVLSPSEVSPLGQIRFTINGTEPTTNSTLYTGPLLITNSTPIRARLFEPGFLPSPVTSEAYLKLSATMATVSSDMPLIAVHSFGAGGFDGTTKKGCFLFVHEPIRGRASFTNAPQMVFRAGLKIRGSSTAGNPKYNWAVDAWDELNRDTEVPLLGMPEAAEWVFHAPFSFDPSLIHNPFASEMSNGIGRYAGRYRFAEIYLNERASTNTQSTLAPGNYFGVYNIIERIGIHPNRVDIPKLTAADLQAPEITGGYLLSVDRDFGGAPAESAGGVGFNFIEPKFEEMSAPPRNVQRTYLLNYLNDFGRALTSRSFTNPTEGYLPYIDRGAWIDFHIVNIFSANVDALRLSTYFYKDRNGPITYGPIWDFDRAFGSTDGRDAEPRVWDSGTGFFTYPWWERVFRDPNFFQAWIDRYQELREGLFSDESLFAIMDRLNAQVREAAPRDLVKWAQAKRGGTQDSEIAFFKNWLSRHTDFMDTNFLAKPQVLGFAGTVAAGTQVQLTGPSGATIYYTLDGTDPRALHGGIDPNALVYAGPITINGEVRLVARSRNPSHRNLTGGINPPINSVWSGPRRVRFTLDPLAGPADLIVSELNYHPAEPTAAELASNANLTADDFEFIELKNLGSQTVDFYGARFTKGIDFNFENASTYRLAPNASLLLVRNEAAFAARYGARPNIAGTFGGTLDDGGETLRLERPDGLELFEFTYNDRWYPTTDGLGFSLVRRRFDVGDGSSEAWGPSAQVGGNPGEENLPAPGIAKVLINEILSNPTSPTPDTVELLNQSAGTADITGWFLTDDPKVPRKYVFATGSILTAGGFLTVDARSFNSDLQGTNGFQLSSHGDQIWLFAADAGGQLLGPAHGFRFGPAAAGESIGRHLTSEGKETFVTQIAPSLGAVNRGPKVGPIVISELAYHPPDVLANRAFWDNTEDEFIEIRNISTTAVTLYDAAEQAEWHLRGDVDFDFPSSFTLAPAESAVLVTFDPTNTTDSNRFRAKYQIPAATQILGPYTGKLGNAGGVVRLTKPGSVDQDTGDRSYILEDEVEYEQNAPWPAGADGAGAALARIPASAFGSDPASWQAGAPTPGALPVEGALPTITQAPASLTAVAGTSAQLTVQAESATALVYQWRHEGQNVAGATNAQLVLDPLLAEQGGTYSVIVMNAVGAIESPTATLTVRLPAQIVKHPVGGNLRPGSNLTLAVVARGVGTLRYQWSFKGTRIPNATAPTLDLQNLQLADTGGYTVQVTDDIGSSMSRPAVVNVLVRPSFVSQPQATIALVGDTVLMYADAVGLEPIGYRWRKGASQVPAATNKVLRLLNVQESSAGVYSVVATNLATTSIGTNSQPATLVVMKDEDKDRMGDAWELQSGLSPTDATDASRDGDGDGQTNLQEFLAGTDPRNKDSVLRIDAIEQTAQGTALSFVAQTNRGYTVQFKESLDRGDWQTVAQVTGRSNSIQTVVVVDTRPATTERLYRLAAPPQISTAVEPPTLLASPANQVVEAGESVTFEAQAVGEGLVRYQWFKGTTAIPGATDSQLSLPSVSVADEGTYSVQVSDDIASVTAGPALLTVLQLPTIQEQPQGATLNPGAPLTLTVVASGPGALTYQWIKDELPIPGATSSTLQIAAVSSSDSGRYRVSVRMATKNGEQRRSSAIAEVLVGE